MSLRGGWLPADLVSRITAQSGEEIWRDLTDLRALVGDEGSLAGEFPFEVIKPTPRRSAVTELIRFGRKNIQLLAANIDDPTPTKLKISGALAGSFYDQASLSKRAENWVDVGTVLDRNLKVPAHTITIGDVAFFALGRIVNRWFLPVRGEGVVILNPPSLFPALRGAVRQEYCSMTSGTLAQALRHDILSPDSPAREFFAARALLGRDRKAAVSAITARLRGYQSRGIVYTGDGPRLPYINLVEAVSDVKSASLDQAMLALLQDLASGNTEFDKEDHVGASIAAHFAMQGKALKEIEKYCKRRIDSGTANIAYFRAILLFLNGPPTIRNLTAVLKSAVN